jgi:AcrR family transcriptional regulator
MSEAEKVQKIIILRENEIRSDVRRNRERFLLENARKLLNTVGFQSFNLPELAKTSGYSKPTIYKYFPNKQASTSMPNCIIIPFHLPDFVDWRLLSAMDTTDS